MDRETEQSATDSRTHNGPPVVETTRARQAVAPGHVRYVLSVSVVLVVVAFAIIYFVGI